MVDLQDPPPPLDRDRIREELLTAMTREGDPVIGRQIQVYAETASTNDLAMSLAQRSTPEGAVIFAERQTRGRGTRGRAWHAGAGLGLAFSILLRPSWPERDWRRLTPIAAAGIGQAVEELTGLPARIKWPNDVYLNDRKLCGILTETRAGTPAKPGAAVMGIGININHRTTDFPEDLQDWTASFRRETGRLFDRDIVAGRILARLDALYRGCPEEFPAVIDWIRQRNWLQDSQVTVSNGGAEDISGTVIGIGENGELLVCGPQRLVHSISTGTIHIHHLH